MPSLIQKAVEFNLLDRSSKELSLDELSVDSNVKEKLYWVHCDLSHKDIFKKLTKKLNLPAELIKLCKEEETIPKLIDTGESLTIRIQCLLSDKAEKGKDLVFSNLIIHMTTNYCLTLATDTLPPLLVFNEIYMGAIKYAETPCFILFLILDNIISDYSKILYDLDEIADEEDLDINSSERNIYSEVMDTKNQVMKTKRHLMAMRDILMRITGRKIAVISDSCRVSLTNLFNHCQMVVTEADAIRDILNNTLDKIDNALMQKLNETMKILAAFAAIFLPVTLIASIYGMNFKWMPELDWKYGYFWAIGLMVLCGSGLLYLFKKMKWF